MNVLKNKYIVLISAAIILLLPDFIYHVLNYTDYFDVLLVLGKMFMLCSFSSIFLFFIPSYFWTYLFVGGVYLISELFEIVNVVLLNQYTTTDNLHAIVNTNSSEASEFYNNYGTYLFLPALILLLYIIHLLLIRKLFVNHVSKKAAVLIFVISFPLCVMIPYTKMYASAANFKGRNLFKYTITRQFVKQHPFSFYYRCSEIYTSFRNAKKYKIKRDKFTFDVLNRNDSSQPNLIIMIIGEGMRYENWEINGYKKNTTPCLSTFTNLVSLSQNYSNGNSTSQSVPLIITRATPKDNDLAMREKTIVSLYKEAGYSTSWIARQNIFYVGGNEETDSVVMLNNSLTGRNLTDSDVLPVFKSMLTSKSNEKKFIIINLAGNHGSIPENFKKPFVPNSAGKHIDVKYENRDILINDYDNKILYQDYIISEIIKEAKNINSSSVVLFCADHGVNLFDDKNNPLFAYGSSNPTEKELHVPLFIWLSN